MSKTKKILPKLRFPEFKNDGEWEEITLGQLSKILKGKQLNRIELTETGKYPCLNGGINPSGYTDKFNTKENTITISEGGNSCGYVNYMTSKFWLGGHCYKLLVNDKIEKIYLYQALKFNEEEIMKLRVGSGLPNIQLNSINNFKFVISNSLPEQQRIAACLSSLDELISAHSQKLELLKAHKKGLMQNLFPQEGKKVPKLRFKEFEDSGEWEEIAIESVGKVLTGGTPSKEKNEYWGGDFIWVTAQDFKGKYIYDSILKLTKKGKNKSKVIPKNSVLVTCIASIGLNAINKVECATNQQINSIVCNALHHYEFVYYAILKNTARLKNLAGQTAVPIIAKSIFEKFTIQKPISQQEQQKIASCLSSLDELITAQSKKIEQLKQHKKGLMQGLFPKINE